MSKQTQQSFRARRLFAAADMLLDAINSPGGFETLVPVYVGPAPAQRSSSRNVFTSDELTDGMAMLIRLGFLESEPRSGGAACPFHSK